MNVLPALLLSSVIIGHSTDKDEIGIRVIDADPVSGKISVKREICLANAIYMAPDYDRGMIYVAHALKGFKWNENGAISSYKIVGDDLKRIDTARTFKSVPCHVSLMGDGRSVCFAEYSFSTCSVVKFGDDGKVLKVYDNIVHEGKLGPRKDRQDAPHPHCAVPSPDGKYFAVVDLGLDEIRFYSQLSDRIVAHSEKTFRTEPAGGGPRHLVFHPNGKYAFVIFELANLVSSYSYSDGVLKHIDTQSLLPESFKGFSKAAAIKLSKDGKRVFCSNRGHNSIAAFDIDLESGKLTRRGIMKLDGEFPRDFEFLPGEKVLIAGLKMSNKVVTYKYDSYKCTLTKLDEISSVHKPLYFAVDRGE